MLQSMEMSLSSAFDSLFRTNRERIFDVLESSRVKKSASILRRLIEGIFLIKSRGTVMSRFKWRL